MSMQNGPAFDINDDSKIDSLLESLHTALSTYRQGLKEYGLPPLSADQRPYDQIGYTLPPKLHEARRLTLATLGLLTNQLLIPFDKLAETVMSPTQSTALQVMVRLDIPDLLEKHDASGGLTVEEISHKTGVHHSKLAPAFQLLVSTGWFTEEGAPGEERGVRYRNNRFTEQLKIGQHGGNWCRASEVWDRCWAWHAEAACRDDWRLSTSPLHCGTQLAHRTDKHFFDMILEDKPTTDAFIDAINALDNGVLNAIVADFPWGSIAPGTTMVDVGGGAGNLSIAVGKKYPHLKFLLEDQEEPVKVAASNFQKAAQEDPSLEGRYDARVQNFFEPQREDVKGDGFGFMVKWILHDWPEDECLTILKHLANCAGPNSKIIIIEHTVKSGSTSPSGPSAKEVLGAIDDKATYKPIQPVPYVPESFGMANNFPLSISFSMNALFNSSERPVEFYKNLFDRAGLEFVAVYPIRAWAWVMEGRKKRA